MSNINSFTTTIPTGQLVGVWQAWDLDQDIRWDLQEAARKMDLPKLRELWAAVTMQWQKSHVGNFITTEETSLESLYGLLQNTIDPRGWVEALGAQSDWKNKRPAASLSVGDILTVGDGRKFIVAAFGFVQF